MSGPRLAVAGTLAALIVAAVLLPSAVSLTQARLTQPPPKPRAEAAAALRPPIAIPDEPARPDVAPKIGRTGTARLTLLGVNDLHGRLEPMGDVGGVAYLDALMDAREGENPRATIRVHAGDMVGASPLVSSFFHDEPTIEAMNEMGFDVGTPGNHELDEGSAEMMRLIDGGRRDDGEQFKDGTDGRPADTSAPGYPGAAFPYVSANVLISGEPLLPPSVVLARDGVEVGFIGVVTPETKQIVAPDAVRRLSFADISETVNRQAEKMEREGVEVIVVLAHSGGDQGPLGGTEGEVFDETAQMTDAVDVVFSGHTHNFLDTRVGDRLVVQSGEYGRAFSAVELRVDRATGEVLTADAEIVAAEHRDTAPDPELAALVEKRTRAVAPIANRVVGVAAGDVTRSSTPAGESAMGDLVADARRWAAGADFAFANTGGIRENLPAGPVTHDELFNVQPFEEDLVRMDLTGRQVKEALESQYQAGGNRVLQTSGLRYVRNDHAPRGSRVSGLALPDGTPLDPDATYAVAVNGVLADGRGGFGVFTEGRNRRVVGEDTEAFIEYVGSLPRPFTAPDPATAPRVVLAR